MANSGSSGPTRPGDIGEPARQVARSRRMIPATCIRHGAAQGFTNLVMEVADHERNHHVFCQNSRLVPAVAG
jgi:hypothetical protein